MPGVALVMVRFEGGPLTGVQLPVDHTATEYRHPVTENAGYEPGNGHEWSRTTIHVYRRTGRLTFAWDHEEGGGAG